MKAVKIGTCRLCRTKGAGLQDSHLVSAAAYRILNEAGGCIAVNREHGVMISDQMSAHLLCADCEDRFNRGGEDWFLRHCFRKGKFKFRDALEKATPFERKDGCDSYKGAEIPGVHPDKLAYLAASLFWRASCHDWNYENRPALGSYEEQFRRYLMGEAPWPEKAYLTVGCVPAGFDGFCQTFGQPKFDSKANGYWSHHVRLLGFMFMLYLGNFVPEQAKRLCMQHTPYRCIVSGKLVAAIVEKSVRAFRDIEYKGKAKEIVDAHLQRKDDLRDSGSQESI